MLNWTNAQLIILAILKMKIGPKTRNRIIVATVLFLGVPLMVYGALKVTYFKQEAATAPETTKTVCATGCDYSTLAQLQTFLDGWTRTDGLKVIIKSGTYTKFSQDSNRPIYCHDGQGWEIVNEGKAALYLNSKSNITIQGESMNNTIIDLSGQNYDSGVLVNGGSGISIKNIAIQNGDVQDNCRGAGVMALNGSTLNEIRGVIAENITGGRDGVFGDGIYLKNGSSAGHISGNTVLSNSGLGIELHESSSAEQISKNIVQSNGSGGIYLDTGSSVGMMYRNTVGGNGASGITAYSSRVQTIAGNKIGWNGGAGIAMYERTDEGALVPSITHIYNNLIVKNGTFGVSIDPINTPDDGYTVNAFHHNTIAYNGDDGLVMIHGTLGSFNSNLVFNNSGKGVERPAGVPDFAYLGYNDVTGNRDVDWDTVFVPVNGLPTEGANTIEHNINVTPRVAHNQAGGGSYQPFTGQDDSICGDDTARPWGQLEEDRRDWCSSLLNAGKPEPGNPGGAGTASDIGAWGGQDADWQPWGRDISFTGLDTCTISSSGAITSDVNMTGKAWDLNVYHNEEKRPIQVEVWFKDKDNPSERALANAVDTDSGQEGKHYGFILKNYIAPDARAFLLARNGKPVTVEVKAVNENKFGAVQWSFLERDMITLLGTTEIECATEGRGGDHAPVISSPQDGDIYEVGRGEELTIPIEATDSDGDTLTYEIGGSPSWLTWDENEKELSGTVEPDGSGESTITATVDDNTGGSDTVTFTVSIVTGFSFKLQLDLSYTEDDSHTRVDVRIKEGQKTVISQLSVDGRSLSIGLDSAGSYTVWVKPFGYLAISKTATISTSGEVVDMGTFIGADCFGVEGSDSAGGFNRVDMLDYIDFVNHFDEEAEICTDYDRSVGVGITDYVIYVNNYQSSRQGGKDGSGADKPF